MPLNMVAVDPGAGRISRCLGDTMQNHCRGNGEDPTKYPHKNAAAAEAQHTADKSSGKNAGEQNGYRCSHIGAIMMIITQVFRLSRMHRSRPKIALAMAKPAIG